MSKLGNFVRQPVTLSTNKLCQPTKDINTDSVIVSQLPKFVSVLNVFGNKVVKEWTIPDKDSLTCPVIYDHKTKKYLAVVDHKVLKTWDRNDTHIGKVKQCTLSKEVEQLLCVGDSTLIIYKDGSLSTFREDIKYFGKALVGENEHLLQCEGYMLKDETYVVLVKAAVHNLSSLTICVNKLNTDDELVNCYESAITVPGTDSNPVYSTSCLQCRKNQLLMTVLWSDGQLSQVNVTNSSMVQDSLIPLSCTLTPSLASVVSLSETQLAILGINDNSGTAGLGIWDTSFGLLQAWEALPDKSVTKARLARHKSQLVVLTDKAVYSCSFVTMTTTISSVLGSLKHQAGQLVESTDSEVILKMGEELLTQSGKQFQNTLNKFLDKMQESTEYRLLAKSHVSKLVNLWITKATTDKKYTLPDKELSRLVQQKLLTANDFERLLPLLTEDNNVCLVYKCLQCVPDVSEKEVCNCLVFYLSAEKNRLENAAEELGLVTQKAAEVESLSITISQSAFLNQILRLSFNDVFLVENLKHLSFTHVRVLMDYLHHRLIQSIKIPKDSETVKECPEIPSLAQIIDWLNLLIDAHCTQLVLSQETKAFVIEMHQTVEAKVEFFKELDAFEAILFQLKERHALPQTKTVGPYCIETLHIL